MILVLAERLKLIQWHPITVLAMNIIMYYECIYVTVVYAVSLVLSSDFGWFVVHYIGMVVTIAVKNDYTH